MTKLALEAKNISKFFNKGRKIALDDVSLKIREGSFFGLLGPNGAGKSTFISILASCLNADKGTVKVLGHDLETERSSVKKLLGIVPQEIVFDPFLTVSEALDFYAGFFGIPKAKRRTEEIINALGLESHKNVNARLLSGGMKRRLLIGKALVQDPKIIVLDEPTAGVDIELRFRLWTYIKELNKQGKTIILTTHYLEEADELCDEIAILNKGKIIYQNPKDQMRQSFSKKHILFKLDSGCSDLVFNPNEYRGLSLEGETLKLEVGHDSAPISSVFNLIHKNKKDIRDIITKEADFEDIFRQIVNLE